MAQVPDWQERPVRPRPADGIPGNPLREGWYWIDLYPDEHKVFDNWATPELAAKRVRIKRVAMSQKTGVQWVLFQVVVEPEAWSSGSGPVLGWEEVDDGTARWPIRRWPNPAKETDTPEVMASKPGVDDRGVWEMVRETVSNVEKASSRLELVLVVGAVAFGVYALAQLRARG